MASSSIAGRYCAYEYISLRNKLVDELKSVWMLQVDSDAPLASICLKEVGRLRRQRTPVVDAELWLA